MRSIRQPAAGSGIRRAIVATLCAASGLGAFALSPSAAAQAYPNKPIRMIVPAPTATVTDMVGRLLANTMSKSMGQSIVVENIPAAGGVTGTQALVRAPKDGYTIGIVNNGHVINPSIYKDLGFDTLNDVEAVTTLASSPAVLVAHPALPAKDIKELLELAKAKKGELTYGSMGNGTTVHLTGVLLAMEGNVELKHVPYKTAGQLMSDVMGGQIDMAFLGVATAAAQVEAGKMKAIGVTTRQRSPLMPTVPTLIEQGLPNYDFEAWMIMLAPAGTPKPVVDRLNAEVKAALAQTDVQEAIAKMGAKPLGSTPEQTAKFLRTELDKHTLLAKRGGATLD
jgi:tripartite-type tricarboxylate transporter receptor subunit TctC